MGRQVRRKPTNNENQVYRCTWRKWGGKFIVACKRPVSFAVEVDDLEEAQDRLFAEIVSLTGDGEPVFEFVPDLPRAGDRQGVFQPDYHLISANDRVEWTIAGDRQPVELWEGGICKKCMCGVGMRTDVERVMTTAPRYDVVLFYKDRNVSVMFSERVLGHLLPHLEGRVKCIPVGAIPKVQRRLKKNFFELSFVPEIQVSIPKERQLAWKDRPDLSGWRCKGCGRFMVHWWNPKIGTVACGVDRADANSAVLLIQDGPTVNLAVNKKICDAMRRDKKIRGLVTERVAMFDADEVLSANELKKLKLRQIRP